MKNNHTPPPLFNGNMLNNDMNALNAWIKSDIEFQIWNLETTNHINDTLNPNKSIAKKNSGKKLIKDSF